MCMILYEPAYLCSLQNFGIKGVANGKSLRLFALNRGIAGVTSSESFALKAMFR